MDKKTTMERITMRSAYYPHERVQTIPVGPSMTQQNFKDETDINLILAKYAKSGLIDHINKYGGHYAEMPAEQDFHAAMNLVTNAQTMFAELPSEIRNMFDNDPGQFLDFVDNPENREEAIEMGLFPQDAPKELPESKEAKTTGGPPEQPKEALVEPSEGDKSPSKDVS